MMMSLRRAGTIMFALAFTLAIPLTGAQARTESSSSLFKISAPAHFTLLTKAQAYKLSLSQPKNQKVIVIMKDQFTGLESQAHRLAVARRGLIRQSQEAVASELHQARATHIRAFSLINAVSATVTKAEVRYLKGQAGVRAVVQDKRLYLPKRPTVEAATFVHQQKILARAASARHASACNAKKPLLEPEALGQVKAQFQNPHKPGQAASLATGKGVTVAFMADGVDPVNPDFVRPNGQFVFNDVEDFSGSGGLFAGGDTEGMLDASSIAAQGNQRYWVGDYTNYLDNAYNPNSECPVIKVVGDAPGASLMDLQVYGSYTTTSSGIQAIQYAVTNGANVINQSFGSNPYPDQNTDPISLADEAAIAANVVIVASTGDSGVNGSDGTPATVPGVIAAGATTSFQIYKQLGGEAFPLSDGKYIDNGVASISSAGPSQAGIKGVDVVAPGDSNWSLCDFGDCSDFNGEPTGVVEEGGTSESAPLTSGVAALVIQKFRATHGGMSPTPAIVKDLITSSATDLHLPSQIQGAGLLNADKAVEMAASWGKPVAQHIGDTLAINSNGCQTAAMFQCNIALSADAQPGTAKSFNFTVTNTGKHAEKVAPVSHKLATTKTDNGSVTLTPSTDPYFCDPLGLQRSYQEATTIVPGGTKVLDASVAWDNSVAPDTVVRLALLDPTGAYAGYSFPQGIGSGYGDAIVHDPKAGKWTLVIFTRGNDAPGVGYAGNVNWTTVSEKYVSAGSIIPGSQTVMPNATKSFTYKTMVPLTSGDATYDVLVAGKVGSKTVNATTIPVILRSQIATSIAHGGAFSGVLLGGNARPDAGNEQTYQFTVPSGANNVSLGATLADALTNDNLEAIITGPDGVPIDTQSNITDFNAGSGEPDMFANTLQFFRDAPTPGLWTLTLLINGYSGPKTVEAFNGSIAFNTVDVSCAAACSLPQSASTTLTQGTTYNFPAAITVHNTGNESELYYADPRLNQDALYYAVSPVDAGSLPLAKLFPIFVPSYTDGLEVDASTTDGPLNLETYDIDGAPPDGFQGNPDIYAASPTNSVSDVYTPAEVPAGIYLTNADDLNCGVPLNCLINGAETQDVTMDAIFSTKQFDMDVDSSTHDLWTANTNLLSVNSGATGTVDITITPTQPVGTVVSGTIYINTFQAASGFATTDFSGDEVAAIPYTYTVG